MKALYEVIGKKKATSKSTGNDCFTYYFKGDFKAYDMEHCECSGSMTFDEFCYLDFNVQPGDMVELDYEKGFNDKASLCGITVVKPATPFKDKPKEQK